MLFRGNTQLIVEGMVPDLLHIIPICDDSMLNRVLQGQNATSLLGLISNVIVPLIDSHHAVVILWAANDGGEGPSWSVLTSESCLTDSAAVVHDDCGNFKVSHC